MNTYRLKFIGRKAGAIGITYPCTVDVQARTYDEALVKLHETHEPHGPVSCESVV